MKRALFLSLGLGIAVLALVLVMFNNLASAASQGEYHVCPSGCDYSIIQEAVDAANPGDVVKVAAGTYEDLHTSEAPSGYPGSQVITQVVYIDKDIYLLGGYTPSNWETPDPLANPTILDAGFGGRVVFVSPDVQVTIDGFQITGGDASAQGGWDTHFDAGGGFYVISATVTIAHNEIYDNLAYGGSGSFLLNGNGNLFDNSIHHNAKDIGFGAGVFVNHGQVGISDNHIYSNTLEMGNGAGIYSYGSIIQVTGNIITGNISDGGAGISLLGGSGLIISNTIIDNTANIAAGIEQNEAESVIRNNLISGNLATQGDGGGVYVYNGGTRLEGNTIISNTASISVGGGISLGYCQATVSNNLIVGNTSRVGGGVSLVQCDNQFTDNQVISNTATLGGAGGLWLIYCGDNDNFSGNVFRGNTANGDGGGMAVASCYNTLLDHNEFFSNTTAYSGGGLDIIGGPDLDLIGNTFEGNQAGQDGGAISGHVRGGDWVNNVILGNNASGHGSAIYQWGAELNLLQNTISSNTGVDGSGIVFTDQYDSYSTVNMVNNIVVSQTIGISVSLGSQVTLDGVLWFANQADTGGDGVISVDHPVTGNPLFAYDGYHLTQDSAAIDTGIDSGVGSDIDFQTRPYELYDLGADEYWPSEELMYTYLALVSR